MGDHGMKEAIQAALCRLSKEQLYALLVYEWVGWLIDPDAYPAYPHEKEDPGIFLDRQVERIVKESLPYLGYTVRSHRTNHIFSSFAIFEQVEGSNGDYDMIAPPMDVLPSIISHLSAQTFQISIISLSHLYYQTYSTVPYECGLCPDYPPPPRTEDEYCCYLLKQLKDLFATKESE